MSYTIDPAAFKLTTKSIYGKHYNDSPVLPYTPDALRVTRDALLARQGLLIYQDMLRDDMVDLGFSMLQSALVPTYRIIPSGDTAECKAACDFVAAQFEKLPGGAVRKFHKMLLSLFFGFSISEMCFQICTEGETAGDIELSDIKYRQPYFFDFFTNKQTGELDYIKQIDTTGNDQAIIDLSKVVYFVTNDHIDPFRGMSIYRSAYWAWWQKQAFIKLRGIQAERRAGKLKIKHADDQFIGPSEFATVAHTILENYQKSDGLMLPPGVDADVVSGEESPETYTKLIQECDRVLLRPTKIPWLMVQEGIQSGSYALADVQKAVMEGGHRATRQDLEEKLSEKCGPVWWICELNGINQKHAPRITFEAAVEAGRREAIAAYGQAVQSGLVKKQPQDENWVRAGLGLEEIEEAEAQDDAGALQFAARYEAIDFTPPKGVQEAAKRGLELRREFGRGGTDVGVARARDLSNGKSMSPDTIKRMVSFFARHEVNKRDGWGDASNPTNGYIAWLLWGGDAGKAWSEKVRDQMERADAKKFAELETTIKTERYEFADALARLRAEIAGDEL